jgi:hypothetical protein
MNPPPQKYRWKIGALFGSLFPGSRLACGKQRENPSSAAKSAPNRLIRETRALLALLCGYGALEWLLESLCWPQAPDKSELAVDFALSGNSSSPTAIQK